MDMRLIKAKLLFKLARRRKWGESHTPQNLALKGFKSSEVGEAKEALKELLKRNWVLLKATSSGMHVSLNPDYGAEIKNEIRKLLGIDV